MVVRREQGAAADRVEQVLRHGPGDREAVVRARAAADLVEDHQRSPRRVAEDLGGLPHLHHERALAARDVVARAHAREDAVDEADLGLARRDVAAHLREDHDQREPEITLLRPFFERLVPSIALEHDPRKPAVDPANEPGEPQTTTLREVTEFMREHSTELTHRETRHEWQADRQRQVSAEHTEAAIHEARRRIDLAVHLDAMRQRRPNLATDRVDERKQHRLFVG